MKKIILGGGGDEITSFKSHEVFYNSLKANKSVLYIPVAMDPEEHSSIDCLNWIDRAFEKFDDINFNLITELEGLTIDFLMQFGGIYIGGGNTFKLMKIVKESGFDQLLIEYFNKGNVIYGGSAGAIILGKDIQTASLGDCSDNNEVSLKDFQGLNLINDYSIWPHYFSEQLELVKKWSSENGKILAIPESSAVVFDDNEITSVGDGVFNSQELKE